MKKILSLAITFMLFVLTLSSCGSTPDTDHQNADGTTDKVTVTTTEVAVTDATTTKTTEDETTTKTDSATTVATTTTQKADTTTTKKPVTTTTKKPTTTTTTSTTTTSKPTTTTTAATKPVTEYTWVYNGIAEHHYSLRLSSGSIQELGWNLASDLNSSHEYPPEQTIIIDGIKYVNTTGSGGPCQMKVEGNIITFIDDSNDIYVCEQIEEKLLKIMNAAKQERLPV